MHKNVFASPVSFTGSYTEDEPNFPTNFTEKVSGVDKVVNFKDFSTDPDKDIKYFTRT